MRVGEGFRRHSPCYRRGRERAKARATYEDLRQVPDNLVAEKYRRESYRAAARDAARMDGKPCWLRIKGPLNGEGAVPIGPGAGDSFEPETHFGETYRSRSGGMEPTSAWLEVPEATFVTLAPMGFAR
jgi:hypothetical protein